MGLVSFGKIFLKLFRKSFGKSFGKSSHLVCELKKSENHHSTSFEKSLVVGGWWCTEKHDEEIL